jgi:O-antigen/teichoic acid export membrane protein
MLVSKALIISATILTGALINRSLGPSGRGAFAEIQTWVGLFIVIFGLSIDVAIYHFANRAGYGADDKARFMTVSALSIIYSIIAVAGFLLCVIYRPALFSAETVSNLWLVIILLAGTMVTTSIVTFLQAMGNIKFSAILGAIQAFLNITIIGYGYLMNTMDVRFVVTRSIVLQAGVLFIACAYLLKSGFMAGRISRDMTIGLIKAGAKQHIGTIATFVYTKVNQIIVFRYCGASEAGIFAVALNLVFAILFIPETFRTVLYPHVIHAQDDYEATIKAARLGFYIWGAAAALIVWFARPIVTLYAGDKFLPAVSIFRILMVGFWLLSTASLFAPYFVKKGAFILNSSITLLLALVGMGLNNLLVPRYASTGAALATTTACFVGFCMILVSMRYMTKKNPLSIFKLNLGDSLESI